jgi:hypothetical protein
VTPRTQKGEAPARQTSTWAGPLVSKHSCEAFFPGTSILRKLKLSLLDAKSCRESDGRAGADIPAPATSSVSFSHGSSIYIHESGLRRLRHFEKPPFGPADQLSSAKVLCPYHHYGTLCTRHEFLEDHCSRGLQLAAPSEHHQIR